MVQANKSYKVVRTLPRKGETYAVKNLRTGVVSIKVANKDFSRDRRLTFLAA